MSVKARCLVSFLSNQSIDTILDETILANKILSLERPILNQMKDLTSFWPTVQWPEANIHHLTPFYIEKDQQALIYNILNFKIIIII